MAEFIGVAEIRDEATYAIKISADRMDGIGMIKMSGKELKTLLRLLELKA